jgi:metal-responsive CopG/Arc/MetJ family transcriptional regulator
MKAIRVNAGPRLMGSAHGDRILDVKTIAISIDTETLHRLERIVRASPKDPSSKRRRPNRSEVVRRALEEFVARQERRDREERDRKALAADSARLHREEKALVAEQADL